MHAEQGKSCVRVLYVCLSFKSENTLHVQLYLLSPSHKKMTAVASSSRSTLHRHVHVDKILDRPGPQTDDAFAAGKTVKEFLRTQCKILVIGAGGLGCEILTNLALSGFADIHIIDMDTIDVSNLNRQFLFRDKDVGNSKAETAARFVMDRVKGVKVTPYHGKIQDKDEEYYMQFNLIICGLDSVEARRWINATLVNMVDEENSESLKPLIDGGTEGFKGQARVILPTITSCYECSLDMLHRQTVFPICTIANTPRLPEHCIEWASVLEWPRVFGDKKMDKDDPDTIQWLLDVAQKRAKEFNIEGVTWSLTQGVVKNIIPAIASTNAIIAAACTQEAFKIATTAAPYLNNYMMYTGNDGVYAYTFEHEKRPECPVCGGEARDLNCTSSWTVERILEYLAETQDLQLKRPSLSGPKGPLFFQAPASLRASTEPNLAKTLSALGLEEGDEITVTDASLPFQLSLILRF
jgi:NEDD8-activating enzyme E1